MRKLNILGLIFLLIGLSLSFSGASPFLPDSTENAQLSLPWSEFKKIIRLDANEIVISMETFEKLVAQTGAKKHPEHVLKNGYVVLTRAEFDKLVDQMKPPEGAIVPPPFDYLITKAVYSGTMENENTKFIATFNVSILKEDSYLKVPFLPQSVALEAVKINNKQALVLSENGFHNVILSKSGNYTVTASFTIKSSLDTGPHELVLPIQQTPITILQLELPLSDIEIDIPQAQQLLTKVRGRKTDIYAIITSGRMINIQWRKKVAVAEKIPAKVYCEMLHLISIEDDVLKVDSDIKYTILHNEIDHVRVVVPKNLAILSVTGAGVGDWKELEENAQQILLIPFNYGTKGDVTIKISSEIPISDNGTANTFAGIKALNAVRETGYIGIALNTGAEVRVVTSEGLEQIAVQKLPSSLYNKSDKPLIHGFRYLKHPYSLAFDIQKHEKISVPMATINSASVVTLFTEDGKVVHRLIYQVRNSSKQFLEIQLPKGADVWSVFVGGKPVESSINSNGNLLIPLIRSRSVNNRLETFPVEVIYCLVESRFSLLSEKRSNIPQVDLLTSQIIWSVYLPNDYRYFYFQSTLEKEEIIRGINIFGRAWRQYNEEGMKRLSTEPPAATPELQEQQFEKVYKGKDYKSRFRNIPLKEEQLSDQVQSELEFSGRLNDLAQQAVPTAPAGGTGILPIQIEIPTSGQVYRFAKTIVKTEDELSVSVIYAQNWLVSLVKWILFILFIFFVYLIRRRIRNLFGGLNIRIITFTDWLGKHRDTVQTIAGSKLTIIVLVGLLILGLFTSGALALLVLVILWIIAGYQFLEYRRRKGK